MGGAALILQGIGNRPTAGIGARYADQGTVNTIVTEMAPHFMELFDLATDQMIGAGMVAGWSLDKSLRYRDRGLETS